MMPLSTAKSQKKKILVAVPQQHVFSIWLHAYLFCNEAIRRHGTLAFVGSILRQVEILCVGNGCYSSHLRGLCPYQSDSQYA